jgi:AraC family transcriptional regulator, activator of mtrCDE
MDLLSSLLQDMRPRAQVLYIGGVCGPWGFDTSGHGHATFHLVTKGSAWLATGAAKWPIKLSVGDLVLFPRDVPHALTGSKAGGRDDPSLRVPVCDAQTGLICGALRFEQRIVHPLVNALPAQLVLRTGNRGSEASQLIAAMLREAQDELPAAAAIVERLAEAVFILAVREWARQPHASGLFAAIADRRLQKALSAVHADLSAPWSLESLASVAGQSRTAFANAFRRTVGQTPMRYLQAARMHAAHDLLRSGGTTVERVAAQVGYESVAAFVRAFQSVHKVTPGRIAKAKVAVAKTKTPPANGIGDEARRPAEPSTNPC